ncbi:hypothetical protein K432DRAFT_403138 [Lepidopterella palustris CBS 459.81]|uniref:BZIP domain-containing protein n=1 Tax=Lepidopterella palustris CBS 459.81 TaxID=1314670 RepID=A0A8E2EDU0_9PEZI|nr:hypothetical protein K432DRAFT_403138 [Lepidopterella palustris CBS 459.81]
MPGDALSNSTSPSNHPEDNAPLQTPSPASSASANQATKSSSSRVITPAPNSSFPPKAAALATASPQPTDNAHPSPLGGGPTSASYVVPPRPKPGRKPATDEPASKRKAQNRESQRAFRARKAAKLNEMQAQVESAEQRHQREMNEKTVEINQLHAALAQKAESEKRLIQERDYWKEQASNQQQQLDQLSRQAREQDTSGWTDKQSYFTQDRMAPIRQDSPTRDTVSSVTPLIGTPQSYQTPKIDLGCGDCKDNGECPCVDELAKLPSPNAFVPALPLHSGSPMKDARARNTPSTDSASNFAEREIDFTAQFSNKRPRLDNRPSITFLTQTNDQENCGFCTDDLNCLCKDEELRNTATSTGINDGMPPPSRDWNSIAPNDSQTASNDCPDTGPGTCADCMSNPRQRAWCQRIAKMKKPNGPDFLTSRNQSMGSPLDQVDPRNDLGPLSDMDMSSRYSIGCSDAFRLFDGRLSMDNDNMDWVNNLRPVSPISRRDTMQHPRKYSALELDTASVIATLQQSIGSLTPRPSDGTTGDLVKAANAQRKKSDSPTTRPSGSMGSLGSQTAEMRRTLSGSPGLPISTLINGTTSLPSWR